MYTPNTPSNDLLTERTSMPVNLAISLAFKPSGCRLSKSLMMLWLLFKLHVPNILRKAMGCITKGNAHGIKLFSYFFQYIVALNNLYGLISDSAIVASASTFPTSFVY